jgi:hypothetical protein
MQDSVYILTRMMDHINPNPISLSYENSVVVSIPVPSALKHNKI